MAMTSVMTLLVCAAPILADQLIGVVQEVDVAANKIVVKPKIAVKPKGKDKDNVTVTVSSETVYENAKGKVMKKSPLEKLKKGVVLEIEHKDAKASKIVVKGNPNAKKGEGGKKKAEQPAN